MSIVGRLSYVSFYFVLSEIASSASVEFITELCLREINVSGCSIVSRKYHNHI